MKVICTNKKATFEYFVLDKYEAGIKLTGTEIKSVRAGKCNINDSYVIVRNGTPYILDWSHATQGNASADAARTYLIFWLNGDITGAKKYIDLFCEKSGIAMQYIQKWIPIVAASQSVKGNEKEREFLLSWVDVVDYE